MQDDVELISEKGAKAELLPPVYVCNIVSWWSEASSYIVKRSLSSRSRYFHNMVEVSSLARPIQLHTSHHTKPCRCYSLQR